MDRRIAVVAAAVLSIAAAEPSRADDAIKTGKWEFSAQVQVPNMPKLPPGVTLPQGINIGPGGVNVTKTTCVTSATPMPADLRPPNQKQGQCTVSKLDRDGGTVHWETNCSQPDGTTIQSEGVAHYTGDTMEATMKTRVSGGGNPPNDTTQHITGHYLGPCDAK